MNLTKQEALNKIEELETKTNELKQLVEKMDSQEDEWYEPTDTDEFYYLGDYGVELIDNKTCFSTTGLTRRQQVYRTEEEAELADKKRIAETNIKRFIAKNGYGVKKEDWEHPSSLKREVYYDHDNKKFEYLVIDTRQVVGVVYVNSEEAAQHLIREHEADLKIIMGIE